MKSFKQFLAIMLIIGMSVFATGCKADEGVDVPDDMQTVTGLLDGEVIGEGHSRFVLEITDKDKNTISVTVNTDKATVGDALVELDVIEGEAGPYGMYIKSVNGITADFEKDKVYWAFYVNGQYAMAGIDLTEIERGAVYSLKVEK